MSEVPPGDRDGQPGEEVPIFYLRPPSAGAPGPAGPTAPRGPTGGDAETTTEVPAQQPVQSRRLLVPAIVAGAAVVAIVTTLVVVFGGGRTDINGDKTIGPLPSTGTATSTTSVSVSTATPVPATTFITTTITTTTTPSLAPPTPTTSVNPMGGDFQPLPCNTDGFIVQVASELSEAAFQQRIAVIRAAGQLPPGARYLTDEGDCGLFTAQQQLWVLYTGPFATPADACPTRLQSPTDSFIKGITESTKQEYFACLCVTSVAAMPPVGPGTSGSVWVGELQRALRTKLKYNVGDIDGPPSLWGVYTAETASAVARFQSDSGLSPTGQVDQATWQQLQSQSCA